MIDIKELYDYYISSIEFLNNKGREFAKKYPKVATTLQVGDSGVNDPDVRRLLETFALFDARINYSIDQEKDTLINFLLNLICPELVVPFPATFVAHFDKADRAVIIPDGSEFKLENRNGIECTFRTTEELGLTQTEILGIGFTKNLDGFSKPAITIKLKLKEPHLKLHINSDHELANKFLQSVSQCFPDGEIPVYEIETSKVAGKLSISKSPSMFDINEIANLYGLLHSYSTAPNCSQFFELDLHRELVGQEAEVAILLSQSLPSNAIHDRLFLTNCVNAINLFNKRSEPIKFDLFKDSFEIIANVGGALNKIHHLQELMLYTPSNGLEVSYKQEEQQYFLLFAEEFEKVKVFFRNRPSVPQDSLLYANLLCSNGQDASGITAGSIFCLEEMNYVNGAVLTNPTQMNYWPIKDKWLILSLFNSNAFAEACKSDNLLNFISQINSIYNIHNTLELFKEVNYKDDLGVMNSSSAWNSIVIKSIIEIMINQNTKEAFCLAMVWGRIIIETNKLEVLTEIMIFDQNRQLLKTLIG